MLLPELALEKQDARTPGPCTCVLLLWPPPWRAPFPQPPRGFQQQAHTELTACSTGGHTQHSQFYAALQVHKRTSISTDTRGIICKITAASLTDFCGRWQHRAKPVRAERSPSRAQGGNPPCQMTPTNTRLGTRWLCLQLHPMLDNPGVGNGTF